MPGSCSRGDIQWPELETRFGFIIKLVVEATGVYEVIYGLFNHSSLIVERFVEHVLSGRHYSIH